MAAFDDVLATIRSLPLPERLRVIQLAALEAAADTPQPPPVGEAGSLHPRSFDELLAARLTPPPGIGSVTLSDMERAIAEGASSRGSV